MTPRYDHRSDRHLRRIRVLKISLPLVAVGILSSLFLFSRSITIEGALPFAEVDIQDRLRQPKMTEVRIATTSETGAVIDVTAQSVTPIGTSKALASAAFGTVTSPNGKVTTLDAPEIAYDQTSDLAALTGGVRMTSSGYEMTTLALDVDITAAQIDSRGAVQAQGPLGQLQAGRMRLKQQPKGAVLVFTSGVRLLYIPKAAP